MAGTAQVYCRSCKRSNAVEWPATANFNCAGCGQTQELIDAAHAVHPDQSVRHCVGCGCGDLFIRKDFNLRLGIAFTGGAAILSFVLWALNTRLAMTLAFAVLMLTVLLDAALYALLPMFTTCYRCGAFYKGMPVHTPHGPFRHATAAKWAYKPIEDNLVPMTPPATAGGEG